MPQKRNKHTFMWLGILLGLLVSLLFLTALALQMGIPDGAEIVDAIAEVALFCIAGGTAGFAIDYLTARVQKARGHQADDQTGQRDL